MFRNRHDAGRQLAALLKNRPLRDPLVLAIPRGGIVVGAVLAQELHAELDVILSRKLRAPHQPELAIGAVSEGGEVDLNHDAEPIPDLTETYLEQERRTQLAEIARRSAVYRGIRPAAALTGRSVILTDDGIATGSTVTAALLTIRAGQPHEIVLAVPVAPPDTLERLRPLCDDVVCPLAPHAFWAIGQFYEDFSQLEDDQVADVLRQSAPA
jgi:putative phosphoribosyl transferase